MAEGWSGSVRSAFAERIKAGLDRFLRDRRIEHAVVHFKFDH